MSLTATLCTSSTYVKSDGVTACLLDQNKNLNYAGGVSRCIDQAARMPEIKNAQEQEDIAVRWVSNKCRGNDMKQRPLKGYNLVLFIKTSLCV